MARMISPREAAQLQERGEATLIDVRETEEFDAVHIAGARLQPLSVLAQLPADDDQGKPVIYFCRSGRRTATAMAQLESRGHAETLILDGGLIAWRQAGLPVVVGDKGPLPIMRQVHVAAGALVVIFVGLGQLAPVFRLLAALVGCGLLFSGLTGACGMALFLTKMPWNKKK
ncbi:MAG: rhodanese-like domain-containing protein [Desulfobulbus sp.]|nr:rhodanese-like domain-containing protein [Desulfobulbus sp.]